MPFPSSRITPLRLALVAGAAAASLLLSGCSQVGGFVDELLPERTGVHTLVPGECFNNPARILTDEDTVIDIPRENCTLLHDNEVIASVEMTDEVFPGRDAAIMQGFKTCLPEYEEFIGVGFEEAGTLEYDFFVPTEMSWDLGDREILCFVYNSAEQTAYSLEGKGAERLEEPEAAPEGDG